MSLAFISGAVPAVALWVPFNLTVKQKLPAAKMLVDASAYFPQAAIVGGWATRNDYFEKNRDACARLVRGWAASNDDLMTNTAAILPIIQKNNYPQVPLDELQEQFKQLGVEDFSTGNLVNNYHFVNAAAKLQIAPQLSFGLIYDQPYGVDLSYEYRPQSFAGKQLFYVAISQGSLLWKFNHCFNY